MWSRVTTPRATETGVATDSPFMTAPLPETETEEWGQGTTEIGMETETETEIMIETQVRPKEQLSISWLPSPNIANQPPKWVHAKVNPMIKRLFGNFQMPNAPLAGRLKYFLKNWKNLSYAVYEIEYDKKVLFIIFLKYDKI